MRGRGGHTARFGPLTPTLSPTVESVPKAASIVRERGQNIGKRLAGILHGVALPESGVTIQCSFLMSLALTLNPSPKGRGEQEEYW